MNASLPLRVLLGEYPNTEALLQGHLTSSSFELNFAHDQPVHTAFGRTVNDVAFDVSELALVTYLQARAAGVPLVMLPVVLLGRLPHRFLVADAARPRAPSELVGRKVGVRAYSVTTGVWLRGILQEDFGAPAEAITWVTASSAHVAGYQDPDNVETIPAGETLEAMLGRGDLDAAVLPEAVLAAPGAPTTEPVIPRPRASAAQWFRSHGLVPINHVLVVTEALVSKSAESVLELYRMALDARRMALNDPRLDPGVPGVTAKDVLPVGVAGLTPALELVSRYAAEQRLIPAPMTVEAMFGDIPALLDSGQRLQR